MDNTIQSDLIRGHIDTIILKALDDGDRYGYDIIKEIEQKSSGLYELKQPTLYSCLARLEKQGFIKGYWGARSTGARRKYFTLTDLGRELFQKNRAEWVYSRTVINKLISEDDADLDIKNNEIRPEEDSYRPASSTHSSPAAPKEVSEKEELSTTEKRDEEALDKEFEELIEKLEEEERDEDEIGEDDGEKEFEEDKFDDEESEDEFEDEEEELEDDEDGEEEEDEEFEDEFDDEEGDEFEDEENELEDEEDEEEIDEKEPPRPYLDTTAIMNEMFEKHLRSGSYAEKLRTEEHIPSGDDGESIDAGSYFEDFVDDEKASVQSDTKSEREAHPPAPFSARNPIVVPDRAPETPTVHEDRPQAIEHNEQEKEQASTPTLQESPKHTYDMHYDSNFTPPDANASFINREYKKIFEDLRNNSRPSKSAVYGKSVTSGENAASDGALEVKTVSTGEREAADLSAASIRQRNFKRFENEIREFGEGIKVRAHDVNVAKDYAGTYYFYCNRLMLSHYLILFFIMALEVAVTFISVALGSRPTKQLYAVPLLVGAMLLSAAFPLSAFVINLRNSEKTKRVSFNFRISLIFRAIVMAEALVLVYAVNLMLGMPLTFDFEHLTTLLVPAVLTTNIPLSAMIFQWLYKSNDYSVTE